ncbi:MAG: putative peptidoglycan glycosyltransferase FtsW [Caldilineaceae bacterium]
MSDTRSSSATTKLSTGSYDWGLLTIVSALLIFGLVMVFSASFPWAMTFYTSPFHFVIQQLRWLALGLAAMAVAAMIPYTVWERWSVLMMGVGLLALMAVIVAGDTVLGATRTLFNGRVQPSEPVKIIILIYVSTWLASKGDRIRQINYGLIPFGILMGIVTGLIVAQPNISTAILIVATASIIFFLAGAELKQLLIGAGIALITFWLVITRSGYAKGRVDAYLTSVLDPLSSSNWQIGQAAEAIVRGGPTGVGLGKSIEKLPNNLPLSWSDNIFAIIGEELGLIGSLLVILLFALLAYRGFRIASESPDMFGSLLAVGITSLIVLQALIHIAVAVAMAPPTGVTLPYISYGGSSLVTTLGATGILLNISRYRGAPLAMRPQGGLSYASFNFGWRNRGTRLSGAGSRSPSRKSTGRTALTRRSGQPRKQAVGRSGGRSSSRSRTASR